MATMGPRTTGMAAADVLRNRIILALDEYNVSGVPALKDLLCEPTWKDTLEVNQSAKTMQRIHGDLERPAVQHVDKQTITMPTPKKYGLGGGITLDSLREGVTEEEVMQEHRTAVEADKRLVNQLIMAALFTDGGFWDATATPPRWANNVMASSHDHYLGYNNSGVPSLAAVARGKRHLTEHGPTGDLIMMANGETIEKVEVQAEWVSAVANKTPLLNKLQEDGFTAAFKTDGVTWVQNDYCPLNYSIMLNILPNQKPLAWRYATLPATAVMPGIADDRLYLFPDSDAPGAQYYMSEQIMRWASVKVQLRGLACPFYWASGTWTNPTVAEWTANAL